MVGGCIWIIESLRSLCQLSVVLDCKKGNRNETFDRRLTGTGPELDNFIVLSIFRGVLVMGLRVVRTLIYYLDPK